jgi:RNA polymerase sigma-70 factor (ECF subfamily)
MGTQCKNSPGEMTQLLAEVAKGDQDAASKLIPLVYDELRRVAGHYMRAERLNHTLQPTALVHEAYLRLVGKRGACWQNRAHFIAVAAQLMRRILIDHARGRLRSKRGGHQQQKSVDQVFLFSPSRPAELLALNESLNRLAKLDHRQSQIVELRCFGGLTVDQTAEVLGVSLTTVKRDWSLAKAWLYEELKGRHGDDAKGLGEGQGTV